MAIDQSPDNVRDQYIAAMGEELGGVYHALYEEVAWLQDKWREFRELFGSSPERIELLNESASRFFGYVQNALWEDVVLHLARLAGPPKTMGKPNLSLQCLPVLITDEALRQDIQELLTTAIAQTAFASDWRNRYIAHRDLFLALGSAPTELAPASRLLFSQALEAQTAIIVRIHEHYCGGSIDLRVPGGIGDALDLLAVLRDGVEAQRAREARLISGQLLPEDTIQRPAI